MCKVFQDLIDRDPNKAIPCYIAAIHSIENEDIPILPKDYVTKLSRTIINQWDDLDHKLKVHLTKEDVYNQEVGTSCPKDAEHALNAMRRAYFGKS